MRATEVSQGWERRSIAWILTLLLLPALLIGLNELRKDGRTRVDVVGAGLLSLLEEREAPSGLRYVLEVQRSEPLDDTMRRMEAMLQRHPRLIVLGLDATSADLRDTDRLLRLTDLAERAATVAVVTGFSFPPDAPAEVKERARMLNTRWARACRHRKRVLCVDLAAHAVDPDEVGRALDAALLDAAGRLEGLRAATQVRR